MNGVMRALPNRGIAAEQFSVPNTCNLRLEYIRASARRTFGSCLVYGSRRDWHSPGGATSENTL